MQEVKKIIFEEVPEWMRIEIDYRLTLLEENKIELIDYTDFRKDFLND